LVSLEQKADALREQVFCTSIATAWTIDPAHQFCASQKSLAGADAPRVNSGRILVVPEQDVQWLRGVLPSFSTAIWAPAIAQVCRGHFYL
jgi:hypothetical protein